jgi:hypothetical protein
VAVGFPGPGAPRESPVHAFRVVTPGPDDRPRALDSRRAVSRIWSRWGSHPMDFRLGRRPRRCSRRRRREPSQRHPPALVARAPLA